MEEQQIDNEKDLLKTKQRERQQRKGQKQQNLLKSFLRFLVVVLIFVGGYYCFRLKGWYLPSNAFDVKNSATVRIENNVIIKTAKIRAVIKDTKVPKVPLFLASMKDLKKQVSSLAPVENVYIRRQVFPAKIWILIREATPVITIAPDPNSQPIAAYTKNAKLITGADYIPLPPGYKTILVLSNGHKDDDYRKWNATRIKDIEKLTNFIELFTHEKVEYMDLRNPHDVYIKVQSIRVRLGQIDDTVYERIKRIPSILPEAQKMKGKLDYIDVGWEKVNYLKTK